MIVGLTLLIASSFISIPVDRIYDGDTLFVSFPGIPDVLGKDLGVRVSGIDTPEMSDSRKCMKKKAAEAKKHLVEFIGDQTVDLNFCFRDKFYRLNCAIRTQNGDDVGQYMMEHSHALPYSGGTKLKRNCK